MTQSLKLGALAFLALLHTASAQYPGWQHSGSIHILTTPEGANLPATALEEGFPLLLRLDKDWFDFSQAKANGEDIRFASADGTSLAYQIEQWDAAAGTAAIWVRIPVIRGNANQEIRVYWGNPSAASQSSGPAVFNSTNGFASVIHMNETLKDEAGSTTPTDVNTTASTGMIGKARRFADGQGIACGTSISNFPSGSNPHSTSFWFKAPAANKLLVWWGIDRPQGKVIMQFDSPPHISVHTWSDGGGVNGGSAVLLSQWTHVVHTYKNGEAKVYVNGVLDGTTTGGTPMNIPTPSGMWIGGFPYFGYHYVGDMDEVRISKVTRSANWVKLEYENQKPLQTLVGSLVRPGSDFAVSEKKITLLEGKSIVVTAKAGGAQKVYWVIQRGVRETVAAVDRLAFTLDAGRVMGDTSLTLQFKAIYADQVKTLDIPVTIKESIPEPVFTLKAPATWDGRETIEVLPQIANLQALQDKGVGELKYHWRASGLAVTKEVAPGKLLLKRAQNSGTLSIKLTLSNGGTEVASTATMRVKAPLKDAWVQRTPARDEKPADNQFYARDDKNEGTLYYNGTLTDTTESVFLKLYADDKLIKTERQKPAADKSYALAA